MKRRSPPPLDVTYVRNPGARNTGGSEVGIDLHRELLDAHRLEVDHGHSRSLPRSK